MRRRALGAVTALACVALIVVAVGGPARAERGGGPRILIFPITGPSGAVAAKSIQGQLRARIPFAQRVGVGGAKRPIQTVRRFRADGFITGRIRCPGKTCVAALTLHKRSGHTWLGVKARAPRARIAAVAGSAAVALLGQVGLIDPSDDGQADDEERIFGRMTEEEAFIKGIEPERAEADPGPPPAATEPEEDGAEEDEEDRPHREHELDAIEIYFDTVMTINRDTCVDLHHPVYDDDDCYREQPALDDRWYTIGPFVSLGARLVLFPGAFAARDRWYSHLGVYVDYNRSVAVTSRRRFEAADAAAGSEEAFFDVDVATTQQDLRAGLVYRVPIPFDSARGPQLRFMAGVGWYTFTFDDDDYPQDNEIAPHYRDSNPYLASFEYLSIDAGLELRVPIAGFVFPYLGALYRYVLDAGQANRIYGSGGAIHGLAGELGLRVEIAHGVRILAAADVVWYGGTYSGELAAESEEELERWSNDAFPGQRSTDLIIRVRLGLGYAF